MLLIWQIPVHFTKLTANNSYPPMLCKLSSTFLFFAIHGGKCKCKGPPQPIVICNPGPEH